ncbi:MAG: hypothetical protein Q9P01_04105 [Anaerolineae bacterium]|nr:hypothetical protein [Anaerolineae bacterium]MDQ7034029.1 hypothetical protein [Anaerolineae bacterium]
MPITVRWDNEKQTIIYQQYVGQWTLDDLRASFDVTYDLINSTDQLTVIHIIADVSESQFPNREIFSVAEYYKEKKHPKQGIYVVVGSNTILSGMRMITRVARVLIPQAQTVQFAPTVEKARIYLQQKANSV